MRWVFFGAVDVPVHAKSGITERQTGALRSDRRPPAHLMAQDGDKWRTLPAKCTHISNSITLSQHRNSHCQSGSSIYANTHKSANISIQSHRHLPTFTSGFHTCLYSWSITFVGLWCVCVCVYNPFSFAVFLLWCETDKKNLYDWGAAIFLTATISVKPKRHPDFEENDVWGTHSFHFFITSVALSECSDYVITQ